MRRGLRVSRRGEEMAHVYPSPLGTVDDMLKHAHYIKAQFGAEHVGLGPANCFPAQRDAGRAAGRSPVRAQGLLARFALRGIRRRPGCRVSR